MKTDNLPPGDGPGLPILGQTLTMLKNGFAFVEEGARRHGPIFRARVFGSGTTSPSTSILQAGTWMPFGKYKIAARVGALAAAFRAGIIASSNGRANTPPMPLRNVRRGRCFLRMMFIAVLRLGSSSEKAHC